LTIAVSDRVLRRHTGGNSTYARRLYEHLAPLDVRTAPVRPPLAGRPRARQVAYAIAEGTMMPGLARRTRADLVHYPADTGPLAPIRGIPTVVTLHGAAALHESGVRSPLSERVWLARARRAARVADQLVTVSEHSRDDILRLLDGHRPPPIEVIPHGVDATRFHPAPPDEIERVRRKHGVSGRFVLYVGNIEPRKNLVSLVSAVERINLSGEELELQVVGRPAWDAKESLAAIHRSPTSAHLGRLPDDDVRALMSGCEAFVFPSRYEGFGLPVLEAMSCGAPVVCTRRGALPEVTGGAAFHADDPGPEAVADAIRRAIRADRADCAAAGRRQAARFTWPRCAERHRAVFDRLVTRA
jgi:glycosyltransferase involved in cell wall biosynthesis